MNTNSCELHLEDFKRDNLKLGVQSQLSGVFHQREEREQLDKMGEPDHPPASPPNQKSKMKSQSYPPGGSQEKLFQLEAKDFTEHLYFESQISNNPQPDLLTTVKLQRGEENNISGDNRAESIKIEDITQNIKSLPLVPAERESPPNHFPDYRRTAPENGNVDYQQSNTCYDQSTVKPQGHGVDQ